MVIGEGVSDNLRKITTRSPSEIPNLRKAYDKTYESDVQFTKRFLIDKNVKCGFKLDSDTGEIKSSEDHSIPPRIGYIDIEVDSSKGMPDPENSISQIVTIVIYDSYNEEEYVFSGESEAKLLNDFIIKLNDLDPDILTGWNFSHTHFNNGQGFDYPYLVNRMKRLNIDPNRMSNIGKANEYSMDGRQIVDLMSLYKKFNPSQKKRPQYDNGVKYGPYSLDGTTIRELDRSPDHFEYDLMNVKKHGFNKEKIEEHCIQDVRNLKDIDEKLGIIDMFEEMRRVTGSFLEETNTSANIVDTFSLRRYNNRGIRLPSKEQNDDEHYEGATVLQPKEGVHEGVAVYDFSKLYPYSMVAKNISPETYRKEKPDEPHYEINGNYFVKEPKGVLPKMCEDLITRRNKVKEERNQKDPSSREYEILDQRQFAMKAVINCIPEDSDVLTKEGMKKIEDIELGDEVWSVNDEGNYEWKSVTDKKEKYSDELYKFKIGSGHQVRTSPGHHMMVVEDQCDVVSKHDWQLEEKDAKDIEEGDRIPVPKQDTTVEGKWNKENKIDIENFIDGETILYVWEHDRWQLGHFGPNIEWEEVGSSVDSSIIQHGHKTTLTKEAYNAVKEYHREGNIAMAYRGGKKAPIEYSKINMAKLMMWIVTEGYMREFENPNGTSYQINIVQKDRTKELEELLNDMGIRFKKNHIRDDIYDYDISNVPLYRYLMDELGKEKTLPDWIFNCSSEVAEELLHVAKITDGNKVKSSADDRDTGIRLSTNNRELAKQYIKLAAIAGKAHRIQREEDMFRVYVINKPKTNGKLTGITSYYVNDIDKVNGGKVYDITVEDNHTFTWQSDLGFITTYQSIYGFLGYPFSRLYKKEIASSVTYVGREQIRRAREWFEDRGYEVVAGDTDSVMVVVGDLEKAKELGEDVNGIFDDFEMEFEKYFRKFYTALAKKRYAGHITWKEGKEVDKLHITGFESVRSDVAKISSQVQKDFLEKWLRQDYTSDELSGWLSELCSNFKDMDPDRIAIPQPLGKKPENYAVPGQIKAILYSNRYLGTDYTEGDRPLKVYVKDMDIDSENRPAIYTLEVPKKEDITGYEEFKNHYGDEWDVIKENDEGEPVKVEKMMDRDYRVDDVILTPNSEIPEGFEVDYDKQLDKTIGKKVEYFLDCLGIDWEAVKQGQRQTGLGDF